MIYYLRIHLILIALLWGAWLISSKRLGTVVGAGTPPLQHHVGCADRGQRRLTENEESEGNGQFADQTLLEA